MGTLETTILNYGAIGAVLIFVLWRIEPRIQGMERAINLLTRAQMLTLLEITRDAEIVDQARQILAEVDPDHRDKYRKRSAG